MGKVKRCFESLPNSRNVDRYFSDREGTNESYDRRISTNENDLNRLGDPSILFCSVPFQEVDQWSFDVFAFHKATGDHALKFLVYDLLTRYDLINRFRVHAAFYRP